MTGADELRRATAFLAETDRAVAGEVAPVAVLDDDGARLPAEAWLVIDRARPALWDANYVWVAAAGGADAQALAQAADRAQLRAGHLHRRVVVADEAEGAGLVAGFAELGWQSAPLLVMAHRDPGALVDTAAAREVPAPDTVAVRDAVLAEEPWRSDEMAGWILARDALIDRERAGRWFGAPSSGALRSCCVLLSRGNVAQVETVGTAPGHRNRGLARAVVSLATAEGCHEADLVFLCADPQDWPQHLYERLGYERLGLLHRFAPALGGLAP